MKEYAIDMGFINRPIDQPTNKDVAYRDNAKRLFVVMKKVQEMYPILRDWQMMDLGSKYHSLEGEVASKKYYSDTIIMKKVVDLVRKHDDKEGGFPYYLRFDVAVFGDEPEFSFYIGYTWSDCSRTQSSEFTETVCSSGLSLDFPPKSLLPEVYDTKKFLQLAEFLIKIFEPTWFSIGDDDYGDMREENPPVGLDYYDPGWVTYLDSQLTSADIPEAYLVKPLEKGTLIMSQPEPLNVKENKEDFVKAARIEQRLFSLGLLPKTNL